ncbi:hypothetical protein GCM10010260_81180 [Streptomyces filipinensis]|uniref:Uncharacterized protein n=1 Tax=Streptomyces filipinensis TaxID=66887 RepID=A0A918IKS3_9ACTN|nr:hypothetical protein GCM10010260_81180 [Streptomyces filipinensis]
MCPARRLPRPAAGGLNERTDSAIGKRGCGACRPGRGVGCDTGPAPPFPRRRGTYTAGTVGRGQRKRPKPELMVALRPLRDPVALDLDEDDDGSRQG